MNNRRRWMRIGLILAGVFLLWLVFHLVQSNKFRIVSTDPPLSGVSDVSPYIEIGFNKALASAGKVTSNPAVIKNYSADYKTLRIDLKALQENKTYELVLSNVKSTDNHMLNKTLKFKAKKVAFEDLSSQQRKAIVNTQDPADPSLIMNDPLVAHLPYGDLHYNINYLVTTKANKPALVVQVSILLDEADYKSSPSALQNAINQREQAALSYIRSLGLDPAKYDIEYIVPEH